MPAEVTHLCLLKSFCIPSQNICYILRVLEAWLLGSSDSRPPPESLGDTFCSSIIIWHHLIS